MSALGSWEPAEASIPAASILEGTVRLDIRAANAFTEIRLLDARFQSVRLPTNVGSVSIEVPPGLYEIGFRCGDSWEAHNVVAAPASTVVEVRQPSDSADAAVKAAASATAKPAAVVKSEASFVVDFSAAPSGTASASIAVTLINAEDAAIVSGDLDPDAKRVWQFDAPPGFWRLRIDEDYPREPYEIPITLIEGYQGQLVAPTIAAEPGPVVDIERMRFRLLPHGARAQFSAQWLAFEETAFNILGNGRTIYGAEVERIIDGLADDSAANPVLGMLALHLCELGNDTEFAFQQRVMDWLERVTAGHSQHPDVAALRLGLLMRSGGDLSGQAPISFPPMLMASWRLLLAASQLVPELIPAGSFCDRISDRIWASSQFLVWTAPPIEAEAPTASVVTTRAIAPSAEDTHYKTSFAGDSMIDDPGVSSSLIMSGLRHPQLRDWLRQAAASRPQGGSLAWDSASLISPAEVAVANALYPIAPNERAQEGLARLAGMDDPDGGQGGQGGQGGFGRALGQGPTDLDRVSALGLPRATVERALNSFAGKIRDQASNFQIDI